MPSDYGPQHSERLREWLDQLAAQRTIVACQLLARRVSNQNNDEASTAAPMRTSLVDVTAFRPEIAKNAASDALEQTAICKLSFRSTPFEVFPTDVAFALVRWGYVSPVESLFSSSDKANIVDTSTQLNMLKSDNRYLKQLEGAEFDAAKEYKGMWVRAYD